MATITDHFYDNAVGLPRLEDLVFVLNDGVEKPFFKIGDFEQLMEYIVFFPHGDRDKSSLVFLFIVNEDEVAEHFAGTHHDPEFMYKVLGMIHILARDMGER